MAGLLLKLGIPFVLIAATLYQAIGATVKDVLFISIGLGRHLQPVTDFPYQCRRIHDPRLQACEDMWFSEKSRQLFLACSDPLARKEWMPNVHRFNVSGRAMHDAVIAMNVDRPDGDSFQYRTLETPGFAGVGGDGRLHLLGFTGVDEAQGINLFLVNAQPSVDPRTGKYLDHATIGANHTIERFVIAPADSTEMRHLKTFTAPQIATPNNIATVGKNAFYLTNDHGPHKVGWEHHLSPLKHTGDVTYCTSAKGCRIVVTDLSFPNGLIRDPSDGLVYVPSAGNGGIHVYRPRGDASLEKVDFIDIPYPIDNLSQDSQGDIWVSALPKGLAIMRAFDNPFGGTPPSTIIRVRRRGDGGGWDWEKVLEDARGEVLPATTTAIHDVKTGRIFLSGVFSPFITVCEKRA